MPPTPIVVLEIDEDWVAEEAPFSGNVAIWSMADDLGLASRTAAECFRRLHEIVCDSVFRGYPPQPPHSPHVIPQDRTRKILSRYGHDSEVTWLTAAEISTVRASLPPDANVSGEPTSLLFDTIEMAARHYGEDHVRIVFMFV